MAAVAAPIRPGTPEAARAQVWYDSYYGTGRAYGDAVNARLLATDAAYDVARRRYGASPTDENLRRWRAAVRRSRAAERAYRAMPEEEDAYAVESALQQVQRRRRRSRRRTGAPAGVRP